MSIQILVIFAAILMYSGSAFCSPRTDLDKVKVMKINVVENIYLEEREWSSDKLLSSTSLSHDNNDKHTLKQSTTRTSLTDSLRRLGNFIRYAFLPNGYPASVPPEYTQFQIWNIVQDACSSLRGMMSTRAILEGMGVGRADVTAIQATIQWILRDGSSMLGSLLFTSFSSANFGQNVKSWRLFADTVNNIGITLDMLAPLSRRHFLALVCLGSIFKALCGVAAGASGAAISEHWGRKNGNIADVMAKNGAQHTAVSLLGVVVSVWFANFANTSPRRVWTLYCALTVVHMLANYRAMRVLALRSLNHVRLDIIIRQFLAVTTTVIESKSVQGQLLLAVNVSGLAEARSRVTLQAVARVEPIITPILPFWGRFQPSAYLPGGNNVLAESERKSLVASVETALCNPSQRMYNIAFWTPPSTLLQMFSKAQIKAALTKYQSRHYIILRQVSNSKHQESRKGKLYVSFKAGCSQKDQIMAYLEAYLIQFYGGLMTHNSVLSEDFTEIVDRLFPLLWHALDENDWDLTRIQIAPADASVFTVYD